MGLHERPPSTSTASSARPAPQGTTWTMASRSPAGRGRRAVQSGPPASIFADLPGARRPKTPAWSDRRRPPVSHALNDTTISVAMRTGVATPLLTVTAVFRSPARRSIAKMHGRKKRGSRPSIVDGGRHASGGYRSCGFEERPQRVLRRRLPADGPARPPRTRASGQQTQRGGRERVQVSEEELLAPGTSRPPLSRRDLHVTRPPRPGRARRASIATGSATCSRTLFSATRSNRPRPPPTQKSPVMPSTPATSRDARRRRSGSSAVSAIRVHASAPERRRARSRRQQRAGRSEARVHAPGQRALSERSSGRAMIRSF